MKRKAIFDAVRRMLGRGFTQAEVRQLDAVLDSATRPDAPSEPEKDFVPSQVGPDGIALIKQFEGCRLKAYPDPGTGGDPWTIGYGATHYENGARVRKGDTISQARADALLANHLRSYANQVSIALGASITATSQKQFDALVSFHFNTGAIARATLTRKHRAGDHAGAAREFDRWVNAGGRPMRGLIRRREAERALYEAGS